MTHKLHFNLSRFYFIYYFFVGLFVPYWGLFLTFKSFTPIQIGFMLSFFQLSRIFAPNIWGWLADRTERRSLWIKLTAFFGCLGFFGIFWADNFFEVFLIMMAMSIFTSSTLPLAESLTLSHLATTNGHYSRIRAWGSFGFIVASFGFGFVFDLLGIQHLLVTLLITQVLIFIFSYGIPEKAYEKEKKINLSFFNILKNKEVICLLSSCALMVTSHGLLYNFFSIYLDEQGYSNSAIGFLWSLGVVCEIIVFLSMPKILKFLNFKQILMISLFIAVIRFFIIGNYVDYLVLIILAQMMHAFTFGAFHVASIEMVNKFFPGKNHAKGQALYNSITYGIGGALGGLGGGFVIQTYSASSAFLLSALFPLLGLIIVACGIKSNKINAKLFS
ncbi:MAG: MFS transporter [Betaproteobacteria bacterium]|nr:MFS transporter [Betaproteobacteria bacterium]NCW63315.1 MFS transporter [Betaproteobacteria bacterium]